jgi:hypothetical protein
MSHVILINPFEVPVGQDAAFLAEWDTAKAFMEQQPGYLSTRLHRSLAPHALQHFPHFVQAFGGKAFAHGSADTVG